MDVQHELSSVAEQDIVEGYMQAEEPPVDRNGSELMDVNAPHRSIATDMQTLHSVANETMMDFGVRGGLVTNTAAANPSQHHPPTFRRTRSKRAKICRLSMCNIWLSGWGV